MGLEPLWLASNERTGVGLMLKLRLRKLLIASFLLLGSAGAHAAELITNGGFESGSTGWNFTPRVSFIPVSDYGPCCSPFGIYPYGSQAAFFGGNNEVGGSIFQDIGTITGSFYKLSFVYGAISETRFQDMQISVFGLSGAVPTLTLASMEIPAIGTRDLANMMRPASIMFQAQSPFTRISFADISASSFNVDGVIDAVSVLGPAPIPEPSTYALMLAGLGIVVFAARRRAKRVALTT